MKTNIIYYIILALAAIAAIATLAACGTRPTVSLTIPESYEAYTLAQPGDTLYLYIEYAGMQNGSPNDLGNQHCIARRTDGKWNMDSTLTLPRGTTHITVTATYTGATPAAQPVYQSPLLQSITHHALADGNHITLAPPTGPYAQITFTGLAPGDVVTLSADKLRPWQLRSDYRRAEPANQHIPALTAGRDSTLTLYAQIYGSQSEDIVYTITRPDGASKQGQFSPGLPNTDGSGYASRLYTISCTGLFAANHTN